MKPRTLAVLFVLVAALAAFVWFVERDLPGSDERAERAKRLVGVEEEAVTGLAWERDGTRVAMSRASGEDDWRLSEPFAERADGPAVDAFLTALLALEKERTIEDGEAAQMGLAPPWATLEVATGAEVRRLLVGGEVPASSSMIVAAEAAGPFHVVGRGIRDDLERSASSWRSTEVFGGDREAIERVVLAGESGRVELARRGEDFWIEAPLDDRADPGTVDRFLDALTGMQVERFVDDGSAPGEEAFDSAATRTVEVAMAEETWTLELGAAVVGAEGEAAEETTEAWYARAEGRLFVVGDALAEAFERPAEEWRSLEWARRQVYEIDALTVRDAEGQLTLTREGGEWMLGERTADFNLVSDLLYAVTGTKAEALDASLSGEPLLTIVLDPGEAERRLEVFAPVGDLYPATADDRPTALWLGGDRVRDIEARLAALREADEAAAEAPADAEEASATTADTPR